MERPKTPVRRGTRGSNERISEDRAAPKSLRELEEDFITVIATGNIGTLRHFMKKHKKADGSFDFDVNCVNFQNDDAMTAAVDNGNLEMIKYLAQVMNLTKNSILLRAVHKGDLDLVRGLCESMCADKEALDYKYKAPVGEANYPPWMTPLMVAATEGHHEIVGYLVERGHKISEPHRPECYCQACTSSRFDPLHTSLAQFHTYSAMSNPAYIPYATADPIHYCFQMHQRLKRLSQMYPPFRSQYNSLAKEVSQFAASLISECRTSKEVEIVLKQPQTSQKNHVQSAYPRLLMAFDFNQKEFIAEPKVQLFIQNAFYGPLEDWPYFNNYQKLHLTLVRIVTAPIAYLSFLANPKSRKSAYYAAPINKMLHFLASYVVFLVLLFMETREPKPTEHQYDMNSAWSFLVFLYFYGFIGLLAHQILTVGWKSFLLWHWNLYDIAMAIAFSLFVAFSISSSVHVRMPQLVSTERKLWSRFDPQLMAEGFLLVATLLAYLKIFFFLQMHRIFGPMLVALCRLMKYLAWFCFFGTLVLLGYSTAFSHFYSYYSGMSYVDPSTKTKSTQEESFTDMLSSFKTFFWGFFGLANYSAADVVLQNENEHVFTELVGYAAFGTFLVLMILVFKSMLIAVAVRSYQGGDAHQTWLFKRAQMFLYFIDMPLLPPPLNLLPHRYVPAGRSKFDLEMANKDQNPQEEYKGLVKSLVERYFTTALKNKERLGTTQPCRFEDPSTKCQRSRCRSL